MAKILATMIAALTALFSQAVDLQAKGHTGGDQVTAGVAPLIAVRRFPSVQRLTRFGKVTVCKTIEQSQQVVNRESWLKYMRNGSCVDYLEALYEVLRYHSTVSARVDIRTKTSDPNGRMIKLCIVEAEVHGLAVTLRFGGKPMDGLETMAHGFFNDMDDPGCDRAQNTNAPVSKGERGKEN